MHGAEHTGAAGAEQDDDGNVFVEEFFLADAFFGRKDFVDQPACATGGFADAFFQVAQFTNHEAEHGGQHQVCVRQPFDAAVQSAEYRAGGQ